MEALWLKNISSVIKISVIKNILIIICIYSCISCSKQDSSVQQQGSGFLLTSSAIGPDGELPVDYTCDGDSSTLPLQWTGYPSNTACFAIIMHHVASPTDIHWYWVLYNIPLNVTSLPKNVTGVGTLGTNSVNDRMEYAPPCSQGPGRKDYIITIYALSEQPVINVAPEEVDRVVLLNAMKNITLATASMTVWYSRNVD